MTTQGTMNWPTSVDHLTTTSLREIIWILVLCNFQAVANMNERIPHGDRKYDQTCETYNLWCFSFAFTVAEKNKNMLR